MNSEFEKEPNSDDLDDQKPDTSSNKDTRKKNLNKRQKYDPRKAIKEAKKNKESKSKIRSAFPEGLFKQVERGRSMTGVPSSDDIN